MRHALFGHSVVGSQDFNLDLITHLFDRAEVHERNHRAEKVLHDKRIAMLFYEESTRTRFSFETAAHKLGATCLSTENARQFSSAAKGEALEDTVQVVAGYCDAIVLRHFEDDAAVHARDHLQSQGIWVPIINAGCGKGQHPTQSLMDLYTIKKEVGRVENLTVVMVGDLKHGRTVRSLAYLLGKFPNNRIHFISPRELAIGADILAYLRRHGVTFTQSTDLGDIIDSADVVYMTRVQKERFEDKEAYERLKHSYRLTVPLAERMQPHARILHPLPKVDEIDKAVDRMPQAAYFRQSNNGVPVRMALLEMLLAE